MPEFRFEKLTAFVSSYAKEERLNPLALDVEKHGSREWMIHWMKDELNRYISIDLSENIEMLPTFGTYHIEVWAGADDDQRYTRQQVSLLTTAEPYLETEQFLKRLSTELGTARVKADSFTRSDLRLSYLPIRAL